MSLPEVMLWQRLRGSPGGVKFRRQHPIGPYVVDFFCASARLVIEVDGEVHSRGSRPAVDVERDRFLADNGCRVQRIAAGDVLRDVGAFEASVVSLAGGAGGGVFAEAPFHHSPLASGPPPRAGEELLSPSLGVSSAGRLLHHSPVASGPPSRTGEE